jgi:hypothetical protein
MRLHTSHTSDGLCVAESFRSIENTGRRHGDKSWFVFEIYRDEMSPLRLIALIVNLRGYSQFLYVNARVVTHSITTVSYK